LEAGFFVFGKLPQLTQTSKLLHPQFIPWNLIFNFVKNKILVTLFEVKGAVVDDLENFAFEAVTTSESPKLA
jgi:hypothetical protein